MNFSSLSEWLGQIAPGQASRAKSQAQSQAQSLFSGQSAQEAANSDGVEKPASGFANIFARAAQAVTEPQAASEKVVEQFARGAEGEVHQSMMTLEKGDISFKFLMTAKNKCLEAYKEITRMG